MEGAGRSGVRVVPVSVVAAAGALFVWVVVPYNNFILQNAYIADNYFPPSAIVVALAMVVLLNPALRALRPRWALTFREQAAVFALVLMATAPVSAGLLHKLPYALVGDLLQQRDMPDWRERYDHLDVPAALYPAPLRTTEGLEVAERFRAELPPGEPIPWGAWVRPALAWGGMLTPWWLMAVGLAGITLTQWRDHERLQYPLAGVQRALLGGDGGRMPTLFRNRRFWAGAAAVFAIYLTRGLALNFPGYVPGFPLEWQLGGMFSEPPWRYLPPFIQQNRLYFVFLGLAYFMPLRAGFSIWFTTLAYSVVRMLAMQADPRFSTGMFTDQRTGAMLSVTLFILWLGRRHWVHVARCVAGRPRGAPPPPLRRYALPLGGGLLLGAGLLLAAGPRAPWAAIGVPAGFVLGCLTLPLERDADRRDRALGVMVAVGAAGYAGWLLWAGMRPGPALMMLGVGAMYYLVIARIVAETGVPLLGLDTAHYVTWIGLLPPAAFTPTDAWLAGTQAQFIGNTSRVSVTALAGNAMDLDRDGPPRFQARLAGALVAVLAAGLLVCGAVHLVLNYTHRTGIYAATAYRPGGTTFAPGAPVNGWGLLRMDTARNLLEQRLDGAWAPRGDPGQTSRHVALGAAMAAVLNWACMQWPRWPLHPVGLIVGYTWYARKLFYSVLFGWMLRRAVTWAGGSALYRAVVPLMLGLVMGEIFALIFWFVVPLGFGLAGNPLPVVQIHPY